MILTLDTKCISKKLASPLSAQYVLTEHLCVLVIG